MATLHASREDPGSAPGRPAKAILFLTVFFDLLGFGIVIPFLPMFAASLGVGAVGVGLLLAIYSLMQLLCAPLLGRVSDQIGRRPVIMIGLAGSALGYLLYGVANTFFWLLVSRALHGACAATISTAQAYVADTTDESERAGGMGLIGAAFGLGFVIGPAFGGMLGHSSLRVPALVAAILSVTNFGFAAFFLPESHAGSGRLQFKFRRMVEPLLKLPHNLVDTGLADLFLLAFAFTATFAALEATFALTAARIYNLGPAGVGWLLAWAAMLQALAQGYFLGRLAKIWGEARLVIGGAIVMALGLFPLGTVPSRELLAILIALVSIGYGLASPSVASLISKRSARQRQGENLGVNQSVLSLARICGPLVGGAAYQAFGPPAPYVCGAIVTIAAIATIRVSERRS